MKKIFFVFRILLLCSLSINSFAQAKYFALDQKYGFRDVKFEMPINAFEGLTMLASEESKDVKTYIRPNDKLTIGRAQLNKIVYQSYKGRLHIVALYCDERNAGALLYSLEQAYGSGERGITGIINWNGQRVHINYFPFDRENGYAWVYISSKTIDAKSEADEKRRVRDDL